MVNNYPEYAAGISYQKAEENVKHFYNAQVKVDPSDDSMSAVLTKDGEVISELPDGGGGSSDFSTANVTVVNNSGQTVAIGLPYLGASDKPINVNTTLQVNQQRELTVVVPCFVAFMGVNAEFTGDGNGYDEELDGCVLRSDGSMTLTSLSPEQ